MRWDHAQMENVFISLWGAQRWHAEQVKPATHRETTGTVMLKCKNNMTLIFKIVQMLCCSDGHSSQPSRVTCSPGTLCSLALPRWCSFICVFSITHSVGRTWKHLTPTIFLLVAQWCFLYSQCMWEGNMHKCMMGKHFVDFPHTIWF